MCLRVTSFPPSLSLLLHTLPISCSKEWGYGMRVGYIHWTGLLDSPKTAKYAMFNTEQKLNILLIHSVTSLALLPAVFPGVSRGQRSHAYLISFNYELQP